MAHFHYTIMGGLLFAFFGAIYYWVPKMTGFDLNERLGKIHFWVMFIAFNSTFGPLLVIGFLGMPRRAVTYAGYLQGANDWVSVSAFVLGASMLVFLANLVWSQVFAGCRPRRTRGARSRSSSSFRRRSRCTTSTASRRSGLIRIRTATPTGRRRRRSVPARPTRVTELAHHSTDYGVVEREPPSIVERNLRDRVAALVERARVLLLRVPVRVLLSPLARRERPVQAEGRATRLQGWGIAIVICLVLSAVLLHLGAADQRADRRPAWRLKGLGALALGLAAIVLQIIAWATHRLRADRRRLRVACTSAGRGSTRSSSSARSTGSRPASQSRTATEASRSGGPRSSRAMRPAMRIARLPTSRTLCT